MIQIVPLQSGDLLLQTDFFIYAVRLPLETPISNGSLLLCQQICHTLNTDTQCRKIMQQGRSVRRKESCSTQNNQAAVKSKDKSVICADPAEKSVDSPD